jgi:hypothetical protein
MWKKAAGVAADAPGQIVQAFIAVSAGTDRSGVGSFRLLQKCETSVLRLDCKRSYNSVQGQHRKVVKSLPELSCLSGRLVMNAASSAASCQRPSCSVNCDVQ